MYRAEIKGIGISCMMNRVEACEGKLNKISGTGNGCILNATIPC